MDKKQILWVLPNYNFYNIQRLNMLNSFFDILVIAGKRNDKLGFKSDDVISKSPVIYAKKHKESFGYSLDVMRTILKNLKNKDYVYLAVEKKNILLLLMVLIYRFFSSNKFQIFSYNHLSLKSGNGQMQKLNGWLNKFYFKQLDKIVFYTQESHDLAIKNKMIDEKKAYWANNTIDTAEVKKHYSFVKPPENNLSILFIGRLISSKRIDDLIKYFDALSEVIPHLKLEIIGDGPDKTIVEEAISTNANITWHGAIINEALIAPIMSRCNIVFIPGLSGLSINHAFAYGRPYITLAATKHGPEIDYLKDGENGYILDGSFKENLTKFSKLLLDKEKLNRLSLNAKSKGEDLSVEKWVQQLKESLIHE